MELTRVGTDETVQRRNSSSQSKLYWKDQTQRVVCSRFTQFIARVQDDSGWRLISLHDRHCSEPALSAAGRFVWEASRPPLIRVHMPVVTQIAAVLETSTTRPHCTSSFPDRSSYLPGQTHGKFSLKTSHVRYTFHLLSRQRSSQLADKSIPFGSQRCAK